MTTVVITGASAGVGRATVRAFARRGASVAMLARDQDGLDAAVKEAEAAGAKPLPIVVDVAESGAVEDAASTIERELGPIDVWVNNAMVSVFAPVHVLDPEEIRRVTEVTYLGTVHGTLAALHRMRPRERGTIVQVGSALAHRSIPLQSAYCAAKHAVEGFTESLRCELLHDDIGVRVTMVQLPGLNTPHFDVARSHLPRHPQPVPPIYQPEVAADAIVWASEHAPKELKVGMSSVLTIYANRVAPALIDRYLARNGYVSQQTDEPADPARPDNLFTPVPGDHGVHGAFDERAHKRAWQLRARTAISEFLERERDGARKMG